MYHHDVIPIECVKQFDDGVGLILVTRNSPEEVGKFLLIAQPFRSRQIRHLRNLPNAKTGVNILAWNHKLFPKGIFPDQKLFPMVNLQILRIVSVIFRFFEITNKCW